MAKRGAPVSFEERKKSKTDESFTNELNNTKISTDATSWSRKACPKINPQTDALAFQWVDINMYEGTALETNPKKNQPIPGSRVGPTPVLRLFGTSNEGHSVLLHVHGFAPYFYMNCPPNFVEDDCHLVRQALNSQMGASTASPNVQGVRVQHNLSSIYGYHFDHAQSFLVVYMTMPTMISKARTILSKGLTIEKYGFHNYQTYESNVPFNLRFMIDTDIVGCNWLELPPASYALRSGRHKTSRCQYEADIVYSNIISHAPEGPVWGKLAPLRILSFDIECMGRKGHFPEAQQDPIIQIANVVCEQGSEVPIVRNVFVLGTCKQIVGAHVLMFETEHELLRAWASFVRDIDPDILTGYNIDNFDVPYIMDRGRALKLGGEFDSWGRLQHTSNFQEKKSFSSAQYGKSESIKTTLHGRVTFDLLPIMRRNHQLSSYSLNAVSAHFLGQQKEDVPHGIISDLQRGTDDDRHRLAVYCLKDAYLPMRLLQKLSSLVNYLEMARVTGVPLDYLIDRGQQIKVFSMILRKCKASNLIVPYLAKNNGNDSGYEGATVIDPKKAYYTVPIATLDFASLYPSIMQAYNLCFSTLVAKSDVSKLQPGQYETSPSGDVFVTSDTKKGILPQILQELLSARKRAKTDMKNATDPMEKAVQNGRQLALKVSANSVYGFTGANVGQLPCIPIASSVTAYGRKLLFDTRTEVEKHYTQANGYPADADVVYGDTDSVMVRFGVKTVAESMPLAMEAAERISSIFPNPIKLEFEKVYFPYLLMNKKRYAGLFWTNPDTYDKLDSKGLETVRRDNCLLVRRMVETCLRKILIDRDVNAALEYTKGIISDLLQNKTDLSMLVITKGLKKTGEGDDYKAKQAHTELAIRMRKRDPGSAPVLGERIAYVIIDKGKKLPMHQKAEDPVYALEHNLPLDCEYYLKQQLRNPLERIFEPIIGKGRVGSEIFAGKHTLKRSKGVMKANSGGMMNFAVKKEKCMACKSPLTGKGALCPNCVDREGEIYIEKLSQVSGLSQTFARLWTQCQNCQGSLHQDVLCTSRDCPIFYKRIKIQKDLEEAQTLVERFATDW